MSSLTTGCLRIVSHSWLVSLPALRRTASGTPILPMSCSSAALFNESTLSRGTLNSSAINRATCITLSEWPCVYSSRASNPFARVCSVRRNDF